MSKDKIIHDGWNEFQNRKIYTPRGNIGIGRSIGFGMYGFLGSAVGLICYNYISYFYTYFCGLTPLEVAFMLIFGRVLASGVALWIGHFSDTLYKFKFGRKYGRRHFFILMTIPFMAYAVLIPIAGQSFWYYFITYSILLSFFNTIHLPWTTLPAEMTDSFKVRTVMGTVRSVVAALLNTIAAFTVAQLLNNWPKDDPNIYLYIQIGLSVVGIIFTLITYYTTWEHFVTKHEAELMDAEKKQGNNISVSRWNDMKATFREFKEVFKIKTFRKHLFIDGADQMAGNLNGLILTYFIVNVLGLNASVTAYLSSLSTFIGIFVMIFAGYIINRYAPRYTYGVAYGMALFAAIGFGVLGFIKPDHLVMWLLIVQMFSIFGGQLYGFIPATIFPSLPVLDTLLTGKSRAGTFSSLAGVFQQGGFVVTNLLGEGLLQLSGFKSSTSGAVEQSATVKLTLTLMINVGVGAFFLVALYNGLTFKADKKKLDLVNDEVNRLRDGGKMADASEDVKAVTKELTGTDYNAITAWK
ncbi:MFS transporter [Lentilactobacillus sp. Marseille-Q4993]|uniref:MFS transporter n=1 Tax=Lentilactobacillus sp. Marseille-Q4993 TaxID=3039492 RepID=UPI0024BC7798|nr:MFS transporter [Lentilactobacillus sp. Marseille-Q4993]